MIARLSGTLAAKAPTEILIDVHGVGYSVSVSLATFEVLGDVDAPVTLFTFLHVREDAQQLFGFASEAERNLFRMLISVNGIGPKIAQGILSGIQVDALKNYIAVGDLRALTAIPGIGRKIAERLLVELRDKIGKLEPSSPLLVNATGEQSRVRSEALLALTSLGYSRASAEKAIRAALGASTEAETTVESLIKASLRHAIK